jgi:hypothetical protein
VFIGTRPFFNPFFRHPFFPFFRSRFFFPAFPVFYGGYPWYGGYGGYGGSYGGSYAPYDGQQAAQPNVMVIYLPSTAPSYGPEMVSSPRYEPEYRQRPQAAFPSLPSVYFQIATRKGSVYAAVAYWVQDGRLEYIDFEGTRQHLTLADVDRQRSESLNKSRHVDFRLPER